jgi:hypothetical protein
MSAQSAHTDYFLQNSHTRSSQNPAFIPKQGYVGVPMLSSVGAGIYTNAFQLDNLVFKKNGENVSFLHPSVSSSEFLSNIPDKSFATFYLNYKILSGGFFDKREGFWSFDLGLRALFDVNVPKPLFEMIKIGLSSNPNDPVRYSMDNINLAASGYAEVGVGYARTFLDNRLSLGAKAKLLFGAANLDLNIDKLEFALQDNVWTARSKATLTGSGIKPSYDENDLFESIDTDLSGVGGFGLGFDLGAVYKLLNDKLRVSLAFTDLGFMSWSGSSSVNLKTSESLVTVTPGQGSAINDDFDFNETFDTAIDDIREAVNFRESSGSKGNTAVLHTTVNAGAEYDVLPGNLSAGLLSSTYLGSNLGTELTLSANYNPVKLKWLSAGLSYSFMHGKFNTIGAALHLAPRKWIHFFIAGDYFMPHVSSEFLPVSSKAVNIQFGLAVPIGRARD